MEILPACVTRARAYGHSKMGVMGNVEGRVAPRWGGPGVCWARGIVSHEEHNNVGNALEKIFENDLAGFKWPAYAFNANAECCALICRI